MRKPNVPINFCLGQLDPWKLFAAKCAFKFSKWSPLGPNIRKYSTSNNRTIKSPKYLVSTRMWTDSEVSKTCDKGTFLLPQSWHLWETIMSSFNCFEQSIMTSPHISLLVCPISLSPFFSRIHDNTPSISLYVQISDSIAILETIIFHIWMITTTMVK